MIWGWLCVCLVTLAVAYSMAEMCSAYVHFCLTVMAELIVLKVPCCRRAILVGGYSGTDTLGSLNELSLWMVSIVQDDLSMRP